MREGSTHHIGGFAALAAALTFGTVAQAIPLVAEPIRHDGALTLQLALDIRQVNQSPRLTDSGYDFSLDAFLVQCEAYQEMAGLNSAIGDTWLSVPLSQIPYYVAGEVVDIVVPYQSLGQYYPDSYECELRMIRNSADHPLVTAAHHQHQGSPEDLIVQGEIDSYNRDAGPITIDAGQLSYVGPTEANYSGTLIFDVAIEVEYSSPSNTARHEPLLRCDLFRPAGALEVMVGRGEHKLEIDASTQRISRSLHVPWSSNAPIPHPSAYHCYLVLENGVSISSTEMHAQVTSAIEYTVALQFADSFFPLPPSYVSLGGGQLPTPEPDLRFVTHFLADETSGPSAYLRLERRAATDGGEDNIKALRASVRVANMGEAESTEQTAQVYLEVNEGPGYYPAEPTQFHLLGDTPWLAPGGASEISAALTLRGPALAPDERSHSNTWDWVELRAHLRDADGNEVGDALGPFCFRVTDARFTIMAECEELRRRR